MTIAPTVPDAITIGAIDRLPGETFRLTTTYYRAAIVVDGEYLPNVLQAAGVAAGVALRVTLAAEAASDSLADGPESLADPAAIRDEEDRLRAALGPAGLPALVAILPRIGCPRFYANGHARGAQ